MEKLKEDALLWLCDSGQQAKVAQATMNIPMSMDMGLVWGLDGGVGIRSTIEQRTGCEDQELLGFRVG